MVWCVIMATEIKGMCYHTLVCKANQWNCFTLKSSGSLFIKIQWKCQYTVVCLAALCVTVCAYSCIYVCVLMRSLFQLATQRHIQLNCKTEELC